jgi:predicted RNase H-like HicB family nuclease
MYRVGFPGWKLAAKLGVPVLIKVQLHFDPESKSYWAKSDDLDGLVVSGQTLDELRAEVRSAAETLLELEFKRAPIAKPEYRFMDEALCAA